jgi:hypothetical protein
VPRGRKAPGVRGCTHTVGSALVAHRTSGNWTIATLSFNVI